jgi:hypothetical protein
MEAITDRLEKATAVRTDLGAIFVSLELSRSSWVVTVLLPGRGEKMSRHAVPGGDIAGLLARFSQLREKAQARTVRHFPIIVIQEAGLDGFWIHRALVGEGIESHVVDPASIATSRRRRRAKTDRLDGETLVRTLLAFKRGEPRVCAMVKAPPRGRGSPPHHARAQGADLRAGRACQPHQGLAVRARHLRIPAIATGSARAARRAAHRRRPGPPAAPEGADPA